MFPQVPSGVAPEYRLRNKERLGKNRTKKEVKTDMLANKSIIQIKLYMKQSVFFFNTKQL